MTEILLYSLIAVNIAILGWLIFLTSKYKEILKKSNRLFSGKISGNLQKTVEDYLKGVKEVEDHCFTLDNEVKKVRKMAEEGLHKVGFIRYNPFGDVGGNQSFSLCLLDEDYSGFVISSIHSREGTRVYSKKIIKGESENNLSEEEKKSLELARK
jgi:hypothetical protein